MQRIIASKRSVVVAADVPDQADLIGLIKNMRDIRGIGGFKLGLILGLEDLARVVWHVKTGLGENFPVIFDLQKAGNDIPAMGAPFAKKVKGAGVDAAIIFPFAGPKTRAAWTKACQDEGLGVIVGGVMTHEQFLVSEGGYIADDAPERIYRSACQQGVSNFVVPGTKLDWVKRIRGWLVEELGEGGFVLWAPGFITQGGDLSECGQIAGEEWHAIVGSAIYGQKTADGQRQAALTATKLVVA